MTPPLIRTKFVHLTVVAAAVIATATAARAQQAPTYELVSTFDGVFANGRSPNTLIQASDGTFYGIEAGSTADGATILQWSPHGGANQQWLLRPSN